MSDNAKQNPLKQGILCYPLGKTMIRKTKKQLLRPVHREILPAALRHGWQDRWLWPFAIFASLTHTGGIYDVIASTLRDVARQSTALRAGALPPSLVVAWSNLSAQNGPLAFLGALQSVILGSVIVLAVLALSVIAQGALVWGLGARVRGRRPSFRECLTVGARAAWRVGVLNVVTLGLIWLSKFLVLIPYAFAVDLGGASGIVMNLLASFLFIAVIIAATGIHFFALNAIILQEAHVTDSIERGARLMGHGWLAALEMALLIFVVGFIVLLAAAAAFIVMGIPLALLIASAALMGLPTLAGVFYGLSVILFFALFLVAGAFSITFQYAAWQKLFYRLGEGGMAAKIHRWVHAFLGT